MDHSEISGEDRQDSRRAAQRPYPPERNRNGAGSPETYPAGPHAKPELIDENKTPGSGMLPDPDDPNESPTG